MSCYSNADCESVSPKSVCKEAVEGGDRTCEKFESCPVLCENTEEIRYCSANGKCKFGKEKPSKDCFINTSIYKYFKYLALPHRIVRMRKRKWSAMNLLLLEKGPVPSQAKTLARKTVRRGNFVRRTFAVVVKLNSFVHCFIISFPTSQLWC